MVYNKVLEWLRETIVGVGCSLLAAGFVGIITPGSHPQTIAVSLVVGVVMIFGGLVVSFYLKDNPSGE